jgi:hypothetical protein
MRFLLQGRKLPIKNIRANAPLSGGQKTFGQQCSPHCGCVLRFEATLDSSGDIQAATYHAKQVVCTQSKTRQLQPTLTVSREKKPLLVDCTCPSLHKLAKQVVAHLPQQQSVRNQVEFTGVRSSLAFSHAVLTKHKLNPMESTHCLDLVEDALTAMIRQRVPAPRRSQHANFGQLLYHQHQIVLEQAEEEEFVERFGRALRRVRKPRNVYGKDHSEGMAMPRSLSVLAMLDLVEQQEEEDASPRMVNKNTTTTMMDWEMYVDELHRDNQAC